jgi:hypothetical protein
MHDAGGQVIGVRLRRAHGRKFAVRGSREGLFLPPDLQIGGQLLIAEGPTDCAALLDLGFSAIGRPSCAGGTGLISAFVRDRRPAFVEIVADADEPGQRGATSLASLLALYCRRVRVIAPPLGIKDARAWKQAGATAADIQAAINAVSFHKLAIVVRRIGRKGARRVW